MKKIFSLLILITISLFTVQGQSARFVNRKLGYSVTFPSVPKGTPVQKIAFDTDNFRYSVGFMGKAAGVKISKYREVLAKQYVIDAFEVYETAGRKYCNVYCRKNSQYMVFWLVEHTKGIISLQISSKQRKYPDLNKVYPFVYSFKLADGTKIPISTNIPIKNQKYNGPILGDGLQIQKKFPKQNREANINKTQISQQETKTIEVDENTKVADPVSEVITSDVDNDIPENEQTNDKTFAIIIGNENYMNEIKVNYAINDANIFHLYVTKTLGVPSDQVHFIKDASYGMILKEVEWLKNVAKAYDGEAKLLLYYAGHGMPDEKTKSAYILPVDGDASQTITAIELESIYKALNTYVTAQATVILDACFSGAARDGMLASGRGVTIVPKEKPPSGNLVVFSAVSGDQTSHPYNEKFHGLFTYFLLKKLKESKGEVNYKELCDYLAKEVNRRSVVNGKEQTPKVNVSFNLKDSWGEWKFK